VATPDPTSPSAQRYRQTLESAAHPGPQAQPAVRLADAIRALARVTAGSGAPDATLEAAAATIEGLVDTLTESAQTSRYPQAERLSTEGTFANHPMIGPANPCSPPIRMVADGGLLTGHVSFGTPQEGPPDCAYGGYIAAGFDAILLMTAGVNGVGGPTRSLSVRYRRPTPLNVPLRYEAKVSHVEERWVVVEGTLMADDTVCAQATAEVAQVPLRPR
jgi:Thioesterase superfamily